MKVLVLGVGLQGKVVLYDLCRSSLVTEIVAADQDYLALQEYVKGLSNGKVRGTKLDVRDESETCRLMRESDVVIDMLPGSFSLPMARLAVQCGVHLVNTMYLVDPGKTSPRKREEDEQEVLELDLKAEEKGVTVLPEMGMDPGIDLILCGQAVQELDTIDELYSYGAGFPEPAAATNAIKYKITWSFDGVLKSYLRPGRILKNGRIVNIPATEIFEAENTHTVDLEGLGQLEAFVNGDALKYAGILGIEDGIRNLGRFVLRWSGHCALWQKMAAMHFLDDRPITVGNVTVSPRKFLCGLLEPQLQYGKNEKDIALIRIDACGIKAGKRKRILYQIIDRRDLVTGFTAMTRTVGFAASIGAQMILRGDISKRGVISPATDVPFAIFVEELRDRGIELEHSVEFL